MLSNSRQSPINTFQSPFTASRHPLTLTHPLLFPLYRILGHTIAIFTPFCCLLMSRCHALALPRRSLMPPHCPLTSPFFHLLLLDRLLMSL